MSDAEPYTKIPNALLDSMAELGNAELRVLLAIVRRTAGWQKECDVISVSQLQTATGLTRRNTHAAIKTLVERDLIDQKKVGAQSFCYSVKPYPVGIQSNRIPKGTSTLGDTEPLPVGIRSGAKPYPLGNTQKKDSKERLKKESVARTPKQGSLDFMHEACRMAQEKIGKRPTPAGATRIANTVTDMERWDRVTTKWAERYGTMNVDGLIDWYEHPELMERRNGTHPPTRHAARNSGPPPERLDGG